MCRAIRTCGGIIQQILKYWISGFDSLFWLFKFFDCLEEFEENNGENVFFLN